MAEKEASEEIRVELERLKAMVASINGLERGGRVRKSNPRMSVVVLGSSDDSSSPALSSLSIASSSSDIYGLPPEPKFPPIWTDQWVPGMDYSAPQISSPGFALLLPPTSSKSSSEPHLAWLSSDTNTTISINNPNPILCMRDAPPPGFLKTVLLQGDSASSLHLPYSQAFTHYIPRSAESDTRRQLELNRLRELQLPENPIFPSGSPNAPRLRSTGRSLRSDHDLSHDLTPHSPSNSILDSQTDILPFGLPSRPRSTSTDSYSHISSTTLNRGEKPSSGAKRGPKPKRPISTSNTPLESHSSLGAEDDLSKSSTTEGLVKKKKKRKRLDWMEEKTVRSGRTSRNGDYDDDYDEETTYFTKPKRAKGHKEGQTKISASGPRTTSNSDDTHPISSMDDLGSETMEVDSTDAHSSAVDSNWQISPQNPSGDVDSHLDDEYSHESPRRSSASTSSRPDGDVGRGRGSNGGHFGRSAKKSTSGSSMAFNDGEDEYLVSSYHRKQVSAKETWSTEEVKQFRLLVLQLGLEDSESAAQLSAIALKWNGQAHLKPPNFDRMQEEMKRLFPNRPKSVVQLQRQYQMMYSSSPQKMRWTEADEDVMLALVAQNHNLHQIAVALGRTTKAISARLIDRFRITVDTKSVMPRVPNNFTFPQSSLDLISSSHHHPISSSLTSFDEVQHLEKSPRGDINEDSEVDVEDGDGNLSSPTSHSHPSSTIHDHSDLRSDDADLAPQDPVDIRNSDISDISEKPEISIQSDHHELKKSQNTDDPKTESPKELDTSTNEKEAQSNELSSATKMVPSLSTPIASRAPSSVTSLTTSSPSKSGIKFTIRTSTPKPAEMAPAVPPHISSDHLSSTSSVSTVNEKDAAISGSSTKEAKRGSRRVWSPVKGDDSDVSDYDDYRKDEDYFDKGVSRPRGRPRKRRRTNSQSSVDEYASEGEYRPPEDDEDFVIGDQNQDDEDSRRRHKSKPSVRGRKRVL